MKLESGLHLNFSVSQVGDYMNSILPYYIDCIPKKHLQSNKLCMPHKWLQGSVGVTRLSGDATDCIAVRNKMNEGSNVNSAIPSRYHRQQCNETFVTTIK